MWCTGRNFIYQGAPDRKIKGRDKDQNTFNTAAPVESLRSFNGTYLKGRSGEDVERKMVYFHKRMERSCRYLKRKQPIPLMRVSLQFESRNMRLLKL